MKITLINADDSMGVDGLFFLGLDFSNVPDEVNAVHWNDGVGVIEYLNITQKPDEVITQMPEWMIGIKNQWDIAKAKKDEEDAAFALELAERQALAKQMADQIEAQKKAIEEAKTKEPETPILPTI